MKVTINAGAHVVIAPGANLVNANCELGGWEGVV